MRRWQHVFRRWFNLSLTKLGTTRIIALMFLFIILTGTVLLMTPWATRDGLGCGFTPALFTATSATCVTGLVMYDTWTQFSFFGQVVILCLIQAFPSSFTFLMVGKKASTCKLIHTPVVPSQVDFVLAV